MSDQDAKSMQRHVDDAFDYFVGIHPSHTHQAMAQPQLQGWFVGQIMKALDGKPSLAMVQTTVREGFERLSSKATPHSLSPVPQPETANTAGADSSSPASAGQNPEATS